MEHAEAVRAGAVERYLLDELEDDARRAFEEHYFDCQECAEEVRLTAAFLDNARGVVRETETAAAVPRRWPRLFWPIPAASAAALVLLGVGLGYVGLTARSGERSASPLTIQPVSWQFLSISRSAPPTLSVCPRASVVPLLLSQTVAASQSRFRCDLRAASGEVKAIGTLPSAAPGEELRLLLPVEGLAAGSYVLELSGLPSGGGEAAAPVARYPFVLAWSGDCP
jgi:hypothetical protein